MCNARRISSAGDDRSAETRSDATTDARLGHYAVADGRPGLGIAGVACGGRAASWTGSIKGDTLLGVGSDKLAQGRSDLDRVCFAVSALRRRAAADCRRLGRQSGNCELSRAARAGQLDTCNT